MKARWLVAVLPALLLLSPLAAAAGGHYIPQSGDRFHYYETIVLGSGTGDYYGYSENSYINGTLGVTAVAANGTETATYSSTDAWSNSTGSSQVTASSGSFTFSAATFLYVQGTDNQSGYTNPSVWFYINNSLPVGGAVTLLNTPSHVESTDYAYALGGSTSNEVKSIFTQGTGAFERDDVYGVFNATYTWNSYFDPSTGYIVGYSYTEEDSNGSGDGFSIVDSLSVTSTTYPLTSVAPASSSSGGGSGALELALIVGIVIIVVVVLLVILLRSRRPAALPQHSGRGNVGFGPPPAMPQMGAPPPVHLTPSGQPAVQQIVLRETVKVNCRYCGTLIDSTATVCPNCGAPRT
jgi:hypothetical protein